jgi:hypothetical protein
VAAQRVPLWPVGKWAVGRILAWADSVPAAFLPFFKTIFLFLFLTYKKVLFANKIA